LLDSALRSTGYIGCAKLNDDFPIYFYGPYNITKENRIQPYQGTELKSGTNAFTIRYANAINVTLIEAMDALNTLHVSSSPKIAEGDVLIISDCKTVDFFVIQHVSLQNDGTQWITSENNVSKYYEKYSEISEFEMNTFYIGKTDRKDFFGEPIYALYIKDKFAHKTELVEGINDMQIHYFVMENNSVIEKTSNELKEGDEIVGVSLRLGFVSLNYFLLQKTAYSDIAFRG
jgi:molybdopterin converting factor small subunit